MAQRTRSEIVAFAAGGALLVALAAVAAWMIFARDAPDDSREVAFVIEFAAPAGSRREAVDTQGAQMTAHFLGAVDGIEFTAALTRSDGERIIAKLKPSIRGEAEMARLRTQLGRALASLPLTSSVKPLDPSDRTVAYFALFSALQTHDLLTDFAERYVKDRLQEAAGVAAIRIHGALRAENRIRLDQGRLAAYGLSLAAVETALRQNRIDARAAPAEGGIVEFAVSADHELQQLEQIVVGQREGAAIYLRDVAVIRRDARSDGTLARFNGRRGVVVEVIMRPEAKILEVTRAVRDRLDTILPSLPAGVDHAIGYLCSRCAMAKAR